MKGTSVQEQAQEPPSPQSFRLTDTSLKADQSQGKGRFELSC